MVTSRRALAALAEQFWANVERRGPYACWPWTGSRHPSGYGRLRAGPPSARRQEIAHRVAYRLGRGPIPPGRNVRHRCGNPACCNPRHLFVGAPSPPPRERPRTHPYAHGERHGSARVTWAQVREMRRLRRRGVVLRELAARFGLAISTVQDIVTGAHWRKR
jgi:HNH endonuclease